MAKPLNENDKNKMNDEKKDASSNIDIDSMFETYKERVEKFEDIICELPVNNNRIISDKWKEHRKDIYNHMELCYPLVHGSVISLAYNFLLIKVKLI